VQQSETIGKLAEALAKAQGEMPAIPREKENPYFKSKYADLADIVRVTGPVLSRHGLAVVQLPGYYDGVEVLVTTVMHSSGEWMRESMPLILSKRDAQGMGSAITYARRYALSAAINIVTDEDDDGNQASQPPRRPAAAREAARPAPERPPMTVVQGQGEATTDDERRQALARVQLQQAVTDGLPQGLAEALWKAYKPSDHESWVEGLKARMAQRGAPEPNGALMERAEQVQGTQRRTRQSPMRPMP
jgi:hypothetical protein